MDSIASTMWSNVVKNGPLSKPPPSDGASVAIPGMVGKCNSSKGISVAVVDANAVIEGGQSLTNLADKLVTVPEVLTEIRDPNSRRRLDFIPIEIMEPSRDSLSKVDKFARATGDLPTLSHVDRKLIALTYTLEALVHGTKKIRDVPPPIQTVTRVKRLPEEELPGWGSNVANLDEWEALEKETEELSNSNSKILPLKDLNLNIIPQGEGPKKTETKYEGKMAVEGADASQGQCDDDHSGDWTPVVSRKTRTKSLRKARRDDDTLDVQKTQQDQELEEKIPSETSSVADNVSNEQPVSESSIACITGDYAMQNVILQMGLRLLAPGGMQIRRLNRWIWKCHGCNKGSTHDTGTGFCTEGCGNGGTLCKVAVTIDEKGTIEVGRLPRITLRGTRFSLPMPTGGRHGNTKNMILREDQIPRNSNHSKTKKKASKLGDQYFISEDVFPNHHSDKKSSFQRPREAMAGYRQRRNPNDNHYSRR